MDHDKLLIPSTMDNDTQKILLLIAKSLHRIERAISQGHPAEDCNTDSTEIEASLDRLRKEEKKNG